MLVMAMMLVGFSLTLEDKGMRTAVANVLKFDALMTDASINVEGELPREKVKRKVKVARGQAMRFIEHEDVKGFQPEYGVISGEMVVEQVRRDVENLEMRFEDF